MTSSCCWQARTTPPSTAPPRAVPTSSSDSMPGDARRTSPWTLHGWAAWGVTRPCREHSDGCRAPPHNLQHAPLFKPSICPSVGLVASLLHGFQPLRKMGLSAPDMADTVDGGWACAGSTRTCCSCSSPRRTPVPASPTATASSTSSTARSSTSHTDPCATPSDPATAPHDSGDTLRLAFRPGVWLCQHRFLLPRLRVPASFERCVVGYMYWVFAGHRCDECGGVAGGHQAGGVGLRGGAVAHPRTHRQVSASAQPPAPTNAAIRFVPSGPC